MKYYIIKLEYHNDGSADTKAMYDYTSQDEVLAAFHTTIGGSMKNNKVDKVTCIAIDEDGYVFRHESWARTKSEIEY